VELGLINAQIDELAEDPMFAKNSQPIAVAKTTIVHAGGGKYVHETSPGGLRP
jgi:hypothetical protein